METAKKPPRRSVRTPAPKRPGIYSRGSATVDGILEAALHVLVEEGAAAFTLRRIAEYAGSSIGNVSRHFPRKEMLVQVLLEELLAPSEGMVERNIVQAGMSAEAALELIIGGSFDQIQTKETTHLYSELWAMANHNEFVADRVEESTRYAHELTATYVAKLNPALSPADVSAVSLFINASIDGAIVLAGYGKPRSHMLPQMKAIAVKSLVHVAKTITPAEIRALPPVKGALQKFQLR